MNHRGEADLSAGRGSIEGNVSWERGRAQGQRAALTRLALDRAIGALFDCSTRILVHFAAKVLTPHPPGK